MASRGKTQRVEDRSTSPAKFFFRWYYARKAEQPLCFRQSCGACGPPYAEKIPFSSVESERIEKCYLDALNQGKAMCPHMRIDFANMRQELKDGTKRDVYRERISDRVHVGMGNEPVMREAKPCSHIM